MIEYTYINTLHNELKYFTMCVSFLYFNRSACVNIIVNEIRIMMR